MVHLHGGTAHRTRLSAGDVDALQFSGSGSQIGTSSDPLVIFLDFSAVGGCPDDGDEFWTTKHTWSLLLLKDYGTDSMYYSAGNWYYAGGCFGIRWPNDDCRTVYLTWTPGGSTQTVAQQLAAHANHILVAPVSTSTMSSFGTSLPSR